MSTLKAENATLEPTHKIFVRNFWIEQHVIVVEINYFHEPFFLVLWVDHVNDKKNAFGDIISKLFCLFNIVNALIAGYLFKGGETNLNVHKSKMVGIWHYFFNSYGILI